MFGIISRHATGTRNSQCRQFPRYLTTLRSNPYIHAIPNPVNPRSHVLSLLSTDPPTTELAVGESSRMPPEEHPSDLQENPRFLNILHSVIAQYAREDPQVKAQAAAMASSAGATLMQVNRRTTAGSSGASDQGGAGSGGKGGYIHVSDNRHPPDFGRIADPEDIFGSLEVDGNGEFADGTGLYQESGTYRVATRDGVLGLPDYLRIKLVERLKLEEAAIKSQK